MIIFKDFGIRLITFGSKGLLKGSETLKNIARLMNYQFFVFYKCLQFGLSDKTITNYTEATVNGFFIQILMLS